jgi:hypothetical protein
MNELTTSENYSAISKSVGELSTIGTKQLAKIDAFMVEIDRANHTAGRSNTQTTNQLMTLTMLCDSPYRRMRQCLAEIEQRRQALESVYFKLKKEQLKIAQLEKRGDELSLVKADQKRHSAMRSKDYIDGALKEIAVFQEAYEEIRKAHNIPEKWDEKDLEQEEIAHHIRMAFRNCVRDLIQNQCMNMGTMEYLEQFGIHPQTARKLVLDYLNQNEQMISEGKMPTVDNLYEFLEQMVLLFKESHKDVMKRIGLQKIVRNEYLYLENKDE